MRATPSIRATVGPTELAARRAYVHDIELDGDENLAIGMRIEVCDEAGRIVAATVGDRTDSRWQLTLQP